MRRARKDMNQETKPEGFINKSEVARRLGKTTRTVDEWMRRGILPYYKPDRSVLFRWSDIKANIIEKFRVVRPSNGKTLLR